MRCARCGAVYMIQALAYPIQPQTAEMIAEYVNHGDEPFISYDGVRISQCTCDRDEEYREGKESET